MKINMISLIYNHDSKYIVQRLMRESSFITDYFVRFLRNYSFFDCRRINFICCDGKLREGVREYNGILEVDTHFDSYYFDMEDEDKIVYLCRLLYSSFLELCKVKEWKFSLFEPILTQFADEGYTNSFYFKLRCKHDGKEARLYGVQTIYKMTFYVDFICRGRGKVRKFLFESEPNILDYNRFLGILEWTGVDEVTLFSIDANQKYTVTLEKNDLNIC